MATESKILNWSCDAAGIAGLAATIVVCARAYGGEIGLVFWIAVAVAVAGCGLYLAYVATARGIGETAFTWREMILAMIAPAAALLVALILAGQAAGLYRLPFGPEPSAPSKHIINLNSPPESDS